MSFDFYLIEVDTVGRQAPVYTEQMEGRNLKDLALKLSSYLSYAAANSSADQTATMRLYGSSDESQKAALLKTQNVLIETGMSSHKGKTAYRDYSRQSNMFTSFRR